MADFPEAVDCVNAGPNGGGQYRNANNGLETSGETEENEATSVTGETMAAMGSQDMRGSIPTSSTQMTAEQMMGGN